MGRLQTVDFSTAVKSLRSRKLDPVYVLMGEDQFLQSFFIKQALKAQFSGEIQVKKILNPDEMESREILNELNSPDLFHSKKMFILKNPARIKGKYSAELLDYCAHPIESNCLILTIDEWGAKNSFIKSISGMVIPVSCSTPFERELEKWINYFFKENDIYSIPPGIIKSLLDIAGDSLYHLKNEVDKICLSLENIEDLTQEYVAQFSGWKRDYRQFELFKAVGERDLKKAILLGKTLVAKNTTMLNLLYPLTELFQELLYLKIKTGTKTNSFNYTRLSTQVKRNIPAYEKHYSKQEVRSALLHLGQIDQQIKLSQISDETAITQFIFSTVDHG